MSGLRTRVKSNKSSWIVKTDNVHPKGFTYLFNRSRTETEEYIGISRVNQGPFASKLCKLSLKAILRVV